MVIKLSKLTFILISFLILSCNSTSSSDSNEEPSGDVADINKLITSWTELDPEIIGGASELKGLNKIIKIDVRDIHNSDLGKEAIAELTFSTSSGETKSVAYSINTLEKSWGIAEIDHNACWPFITLDVMDARKSINAKFK